MDEEPIRKLKDGFYWHVNLEWVKWQIVKVYTHNDNITEQQREDNMGRKLIISESLSNYGKLGYVFFALNGSPPKGYGVYIPNQNTLRVISCFGKTRNFKDTIVEEYKDYGKYK